MRALAIPLFVLSFAAMQAAAQAPRFEVASVRPNNSVGEGGSMSSLAGSRFTAINVPLH